jgi:hypothetical protein
MPFPIELIEEERWRKLLQHPDVPAFTSVDDLLQRDNFYLLRQLQCSHEEVLALKRYVLEQVPNQLPVQRRSVVSSSSSAAHSLLSHFDSVFPTHASTPAQLSFSAPIATGLAKWDSMFHGGLPRGQITCIAGETGSGRSQLCLHAALAAAWTRAISPPSTHCSKIMYIDTSGQVTARRLHSMLTSIGEIGTSQAEEMKMLDALSLLDIRCCFSLFEGLDLLTELIDNQQRDSETVYDFIIIDSLYQWIMPLLSDTVEKFPSSGTTTTASLSTTAMAGSGPASASTVVNFHPLVAKLGLLLRTLVSTRILTSNSNDSNDGILPVVLMTTLSTWILSPQVVNQYTASKTSSADRGVESYGNRRSSGAGNLHGYQRQFANYWRDISDTLLLTTNLSVPSSLPPRPDAHATRNAAGLWHAPKTSLDVRVIYRPPYFKAQPEEAILEIS